MLTLLSVLTFTLFAALYPVFLWIVASQPMGRGFHRLTLGISSVCAGTAFLFFWLLNANLHLRLSVAVWLLALVAVTWFYWNRQGIQEWVVTVPSLLGLVVYVRVVRELVAGPMALMILSILGGLIVCGAVFSMVLGHRYLNVANLPIGLLRRSVTWLLGFLIIRALWDLSHFVQGEIDFNGQVISLIEFIQSFNGFFLFIALFFGTVVPIVLCLLTLRTVSLHSTQSATGLLYIVVISVIMGDLFYKYYALQFGLFL
ncbi:MAG: hypothetical protein ACE5GH_04175 [Fidelibacterota bacterium]